MNFWFCPERSRRRLLCALFALLWQAVWIAVCPAAPPDETSGGRVREFDRADVRLLQSPFREARDLNLKYLLELEPDRLLHSYRREAGLKPKAPIYGGWESKAISGTALGHYLTALSIQYRSTGDAWLFERIRYIVDELESCQRQHGDGYLSGIPAGRQMFNEVSSGKITADQTNLNGSWAPWYVIHKTMSGLRDASRLARIEKARPMLIAMADWVARTSDGLTEEQLETMLRCEFGGMSEILLDVYEVTGDERHRAAADRFYHNAVLNPLERREDRLNGLHANTQIPKLIGEARRYELLGGQKARALAEFFWDRVVNHHSYHMGGHSDSEHFGPPDMLAGRLGTMTAETCNTYHMLKLTRHLFSWNPEARYFDFYERALYNHIRASQEPRRGRFAYFVTLMPGHFRTYSTPFDAFWCCVCTGMENHVRYAEGIYNKDDRNSELYVNLYIPSSVIWKEKGLRVTQRTRYPYNGTVTLEVETSAPIEAALKVRIPRWIAKTSSVRAELNGTTYPLSAEPGSYAEIRRTWIGRETLRLHIPLELRKESMPDNPRRIALFYGPLMLAARMGTEGIKPPAPYASEHTAYLQAKLPPTPVLVAGDRPLDEWIELVDAANLTFKTRAVGQPNDVELAPFFDRYYERYTGYLDNFSPAEWQERETAYRAENERVRMLEARTIDLVRSGDGQMERDHAIKSEKSRSGNFENRMWRDATPGGWFSYEMKAESGTSLSLMCLYWGGDSGERHFRITANGHTVAEPRLENRKPGEFFREEYPLPLDAIAYRNGRITVRFDGLPGNFAGGVFEVRLLRAE